MRHLSHSQGYWGCLGQLIDERSIKTFHHPITLQMIGAGPGFLNSQQLANVSIHHPKNTQTTISKKVLYGAPDPYRV